MKKTLLLLIVGMMIVSLTASGNTQQSGNTDRNADESSEAPKQKEQPGESGSNLELSERTDTADLIGQGDILVAYFSKTGNTETIANMIAKYTKGDLFRVETVNVYPDDYNDLIEVARQEQDNEDRQELASTVENMDGYQTIFVGFAGGIIGLNQEKPINQGFALV